MWSDNETTNDLLGFKIHSDLIRDVVTDPDLLPAVVGVFGDWGGGKSSIMKMLEHDLSGESYNDVACLYFNGWMFEGYEDAKTALLSSILLALGENKRFEPAVKEKVVGLLKRVQWMELGRQAIKYGAPLAVAAMTGGVGALPAAGAALVSAAQSKLAKVGADEDENGKSDKEADKEETWLEKIIASPEKPDLLEVRKFREDFEKLLALTKLRSLVILIDDLDRCLPDRIIETLEAIKLFVAVPKTAFVIGADPRIVRHAIATRYARRELDTAEGSEEEYDLVRDYLEKLIQIPYHLPRLSPAEMETYINLLHCHKLLGEEADRSTVLERLRARRQQNCYTAFGLGDIRDALGSRPLPPELELQLAWSSAVSLPLTEGLKGNPRQVKRMLNAMVLRTKLARVAGLEIRPEVLAKLMVLEYTAPKRFSELDTWQTTDQGHPKQLPALEDAARAGHTAKSDSDETLAEWRKPRLQSWLQMEPALANVDLRDYFWIARDRTKSTLSNASLLSPIVRRVFNQLIGSNRAEQMLAVKAVQDLDATETEALLQFLEQQIVRHPEQDAGPEALRLLIEAKTEGAATCLFAAVVKAPAKTLTPSIANKLATLATTVKSLRPDVVKTLEILARQTGTKIATAAGIALKDLK